VPPRFTDLVPQNHVIGLTLFEVEAITHCNGGLCFPI